MPAETSPLAPTPLLSGPQPPAPAPLSYRRTRTRTLHLAVAIDGGSGQHPPEYYVELARLAERGALDFVTLGGGGGRDGHHGDRGRASDALALLARVAPATDRIGLVPSVDAAPSSSSAAGPALDVATLDWVSGGRAGWTVTVPAEGEDGEDKDEGGRARGRDTGRGAAARQRAAERAEARWRRAGDAIEAAALAWDSGDGPRPPQGRPVIALDVTEPGARAVAARHADIAFVRAADKEQADRIRGELRLLTAEMGRDPDRLLVLGELSVDLGGGELGWPAGMVAAPVADGAGGVLFSGGPVDLAELIADWQRSGVVDGFHVRPVEPRRDLERFVNGTAALLQHRGLFRSFHPGATLREHLGLRGRAGDRLAATGGVMA
ncbi:LLM class flavin-dependent oxidoreductase [Streptomyces polygonati]|uniref:LLM class flavin-dependent oxidoreductase n=1 Tax=Streptomyces polygonati TaxID=1617087 RepID=A0ABV8HVE6_9ACTN